MTLPSSSWRDSRIHFAFRTCRKLHQFGYRHPFKAIPCARHGRIEFVLLRILALDSLIGFVFPREERPSVDDARKRKEEESAAIRAVEETTAPKTYCDAYEKLIEEDGERLKSVESRLGSILGLTSITTALLISGILALINGTLGDSSKVVRGIAGAGAVYLSLQIICSTLAAV